MRDFQAAVRVDNKGRLLVPKAVRNALGLKRGDALFLRFGPESGTIRLVKAQNPFDVLVDEALKEHEAGETVDLRELLRTESLS